VSARCAHAAGVDHPHRPGAGHRAGHRQRPPQQEIAEQFQIAEGTVKVHLHSVYQKLGVDNRLALMLYARENAIA
jgi:hypothetical protein